MADLREQLIPSAPRLRMIDAVASGTNEVDGIELPAVMPVAAGQRCVVLKLGDAPGLIVPIATDWQTLTLASANWTQTRTPQWRVNAGRVELRGFLARTTSTFAANGTLFTLGAATNPPAPSQAYTVHGAAGIAAATPDATVVVWQVDAGAGTFRSSVLTHAVAVGDTVSLDGICWPIN